ncbi:MAG: methyltransferase domain-containing protein [Myxococcota bacterium]
MSEPPRPLVDLTPEAMSSLMRATVSHYQQNAEDFREGTKDHDVSQNVQALLRHLPGSTQQRILDLGCGPGRDLATFAALGHEPVGLDGAAAFVKMARASTGCEVLHQDFLALDLPAARFDGIFANAVLFHVPTQALSRVLQDLRRALVADGVLFVSNPRGPDIEQQQGLRYGAYLSMETWTRFVTAAGFELIEHYFRPPNRPRAAQPWLATVWRAL